MNERIQELSAIAKHLSTDEATHLSRVHNRTLSLDEEQEIFTTKFAELIVRECAEFARQHNLEKADRSHLIHRAIKQHFGVEE
jgi:hypothetical protein